MYRYNCEISISGTTQNKRQVVIVAGVKISVNNYLLLTFPMLYDDKCYVIAHSSLVHISSGKLVAQ